MTTTQRKFRRGLSIERRTALRADLLEAELEKARRRAMSLHLSLTCRNAMDCTGAEDSTYVQLLHQQCRGELPGGVGCLCVCHDVIGPEIVTSAIEVPA